MFTFGILSFDLNESVLWTSKYFYPELRIRFQEANPDSILPGLFVAIDKKNVLSIRK